jgi:aspartate carbamoyltransferase catalytic subunit
MMAHATPTHGVTVTRRHILDVDDWTPAELDALMARATAMREIIVSEPNRRLATLRGEVVVNLFYENSTRTRVSFELAAKRLGADVVNVTATGSSVEKGESLRDTVRTIEALGATFVVIRSSRSGAPELVARSITQPVLNAGDGWHAHPSQALLDLFTLRRHLGSLAGKRIVIVGDILHSRVARSNIWSLTANGAEVVLCAPPTLLPPAAADAYVSQPVPGTQATRRIVVEPHIEVAMPGAHAVMVLRLQKERQAAGLLPSLREYSQRFGLTGERLALAEPDALVLHPGPMNEGIEIAPEVVAGSASVIEEQVANGIAVRMALLEVLHVAHRGSAA